MRGSAMRLLAAASGLLTMMAYANAACEPAKVADRYPSLAGRTIKIAISPLYAPFSYTAPNSDELIGGDVDLSSAALHCVGLKYEYVKGVFSSLLPTLLSGQADVLNANLYYSDERAKSVDFVVYMKAGAALIVPKSSTHVVRSMDDLCGLATSLVVGSVSQKVVEDQSQKCVAAGKPAIAMTLATETDAALRGLMNGRIDFLLDNAGAAAVRVKDDPSLQIAFTQTREVKVGIAAKKGNDAVLQAYRDGLKELYEDGTTAKIFAKYGLDGQLAIEPEIIR